MQDTQPSKLQEYRAVSRVPFCLHGSDAHSRLAPPPRIRVLPSFYHTSLSAAYSSRKADSPILASSLRRARQTRFALHCTTRAHGERPQAQVKVQVPCRETEPLHTRISHRPRARGEKRSPARPGVAFSLPSWCLMSCVRNPDSSSFCFLDVSSLCTVHQ